jgi:hypothetical protein
MARSMPGGLFVDHAFPASAKSLGKLIDANEKFL